MTGTAVESLVCRQLLRAGGRAPWALVTGGGNYDRTASGGDDRPVRAGDMVWIDCGCAVDGYWSDYSRAGVVGGASARQREAQRAVRELTREAVAAIEPGVTMSSVARRAEGAIESLDLPVTDRVSRRAGRMGHGLGLQVTELPSLCADTDRTFEPGTVVTVEPAFATAYGTFHVEENVVVTDTGSRTLSDDRWRLRSV
jgi:Xaa-Pro aminopeptidase